MEVISVFTFRVQEVTIQFNKDCVHVRKDSKFIFRDLGRTAIYF